MVYKVVITRSAQQAPDLVSALLAFGVEPILLPCIETLPAQDTTRLDEALRNLNHYAWIIFTSPNAVQVTWERLIAIEMIASKPAHLAVAAVGPKTAHEVERHGWRVDFIPEKFISDQVVTGLGNLLGMRVLLPLADIAGDTLEKDLCQAGAEPEVITVYHTISSVLDADAIAVLRAGADILTFTSGSTVRNFVTLVSRAGLDPLNLPGNPQVVCIGPKTAYTARQSGFEVAQVADVYSVEGMAAAVEKVILRMEKNQ